MRQLIYKHAFWLLMAAILLAVIVNGQSDKPRLCNPKCTAIHRNGDICTTPNLDSAIKLKPSGIIIGTRIQNMAMMEMTFGWHFVIRDSLGLSAERDSSGKWKINNAERALEMLYQQYIKPENERFKRRLEERKEPEKTEPPIITIGFIDTPKNQYSGKHFNITDDAGKVLATRNPSGVWTIKDALFSLEFLYQGYEDLMIKCDELIEMFSYIREDGTVSDKKKLAKAIQNFLNKYSK